MASFESYTRRHRSCHRSKGSSIHSRPETAHGIYRLAQIYELREKAVHSARVMLRLPMVLQDLVDKFDFPGMTGAYLDEVWR